MDLQDILNKVQNVFQEALDDNNIRLGASTTQHDIEGWVSINHIMIVVNIEKQFNIKFTSKEMFGWKNVGEIVNSIASHLSKT
jgi:acyl carrier protein